MRLNGILCIGPRAISPANELPNAFTAPVLVAYRFGSLPLFSTDDTVCYRISSNLTVERKKMGMILEVTRGWGNGAKAPINPVIVEPLFPDHFPRMRMPDDSSTLRIERRIKPIPRVSAFPGFPLDCTSRIWRHISHTEVSRHILLAPNTPILFSAHGNPRLGIHVF